MNRDDAGCSGTWEVDKFMILMWVSNIRAMVHWGPYWGLRRAYWDSNVGRFACSLRLSGV